MDKLSFGGFATASGKRCSVSENALKNAELLFDSVPFADVSECCPISAEHSVTETPAPHSGLNWNNLSEKSFRKISDFPSRQLVNFDEILNESSHHAEMVVSDCTPSISLCWKETDFTDSCKSSGSVNLLSNKFSLYSPLPPVSDNSELTNTSALKPGGFATASGKSVAVSENSLKFAEKFFSSAIDDSFCQNLSSSTDNANCSDFQNVGFNNVGVLCDNRRAISCTSTEPFRKLLKCADDDSSSKSCQKNLAKCDDNKLLSPVIRKSPSKSNELSPVINSKRRRQVPTPSFVSKCKTTKLLTSNNSRGLTLYKQLYDNSRVGSAFAKVGQEKSGAVDDCSHIDNPSGSHLSKDVGLADLVSSKSRISQDGFLYQHRQSIHNQRVSLSKSFLGQFPQIYDEDELSEFQIDESVRLVSFCNADTFLFKTRHLQSLPRDPIARRLVIGSDGVLAPEAAGAQSLSVDDIISSFLDSLSTSDGRLVTAKWATNHARLIIWKLAALEVAFPHICGSRVFSSSRVMEELRYRFDREITHAQRSCLKKILECDDSSTKPMILCVCAVFDADPKEFCATVELTDGWYSVKTQLDRPLTALLRSGRVRVGDKLFIVLAHLHGIESGFPPLELPDNVRMSISYNCVRRARWSAKLGFHHPVPLRSVAFSLSSFCVDGGVIPGVKLVLARVYPMMFLERKADGTRVVRSQRQEDAARMVAERDYERLVEKARERLEKRWSISPKNMSISRRLSANALKNLQTGEELHLAMESSGELSHFKQGLSPSQVRKLETFDRNNYESKRAEIQREIEELCEKEMGGSRGKVTHFVKIRVLGLHPNDRKYNNGTILTLWNPHSELMERLTEGKAFLVNNLQGRDNRVTKSSHCPVQLSTTRATVFQDIALPPDSIALLCPHSQLTSLKDLQDPNLQFQFDEIHLAGIVVEIISAVRNCGERVYLFDGDRSFVAVCFLKSLSELRLSNVFTPGAIVCLSHLYKKAQGSGSLDSNRTSVPFLLAGDRCHVIANSASQLFVMEAKRLSEFTRTHVSFLSQARTLLRSIRLGQMDDNNCIMTPSPQTPFASDRMDTPPASLVHHPNALSNCTGCPDSTSSSDIKTTPGIRSEAVVSDSDVSSRLRRRREDIRRRQDLLSRLVAPGPSNTPVLLVNRSSAVLQEFKSPVISRT